MYAENVTAVPITTRYSKPASDLPLTAPASKPPASPDTSETAASITAPARSGIAEAAIGDDGTRTCRVATVPDAHESAMRSSSEASTAVSPPPLP